MMGNPVEYLSSGHAAGADVAVSSDCIFTFQPKRPEVWQLSQVTQTCWSFHPKTTVWSGPGTQTTAWCWADPALQVDQFGQSPEPTRADFNTG